MTILDLEYGYGYTSTKITESKEKIHTRTSDEELLISHLLNNGLTNKDVTKAIIRLQECIKEATLDYSFKN